MKKLKIAFFGTPYFSARFLEKLLTDISIKHLIEIKLVVTQPDKPVGRKQILTKSPVKTVAEKFGVKVYDGQLSNSESLINKLKKIDLALIYYYGQIISKNLLIIPKFGFWNIHFSLLPKLRGTTPATFSLILGDKKTAVSLVQTDEKLDHGDLVTQQEVNINPTETRVQLEQRLHNISYKIFIEQVNNLLNNKIKLTPQNHSQATYTRFPTKNDGFIALSILKKALKNEPLTFDKLPKIIFEYINKYNLIRNWKPVLREVEGLDIRNSAKIIFNYFQGLHPWPGIWTLVKIKGIEKRLKLTDLDYSSGKLIIKKVQLEGKKEVNFETFNSAYSVF